MVDAVEQAAQRHAAALAAEEQQKRNNAPQCTTPVWSGNDQSNSQQEVLENNTTTSPTHLQSISNQPSDYSNHSSEFEEEDEYETNDYFARELNEPLADQVRSGSNGNTGTLYVRVASDMGSSYVIPDLVNTIDTDIHQRLHSTSLEEKCSVSDLMNLSESAMLSTTEVSTAVSMSTYCNKQSVGDTLVHNIPSAPIAPGIDNFKNGASILHQDTDNLAGINTIDLNSLRHISSSPMCANYISNKNSTVVCDNDTSLSVEQHPIDSLMNNVHNRSNSNQLANEDNCRGNLVGSAIMNATVINNMPGTLPNNVNELNSRIASQYSQEKTVAPLPNQAMMNNLPSVPSTLASIFVVCNEENSANTISNNIICDNTLSNNHSLERQESQQNLYTVRCTSEGTNIDVHRHANVIIPTSLQRAVIPEISCAQIVPVTQGSDVQQV